MNALDLDEKARNLILLPDATPPAKRAARLCGVTRPCQMWAASPTCSRASHQRLRTLAEALH
jgi:hypothetical protein